MDPRPALATAAVLACALCASAHAQEATPEPKVQLTVIEDDAMRIEELKVRGQTQRISVQPKGGMKGYEIIPADPGRDTSESAGTRGAAGKRVWRVLSF